MSTEETCEWGIRSPRRDGEYCTLPATYTMTHTVETVDGVRSVFQLLTCHVHKRVADRLGLPIDRR
jgi:hypothetical protein